jgi:ubiquinone/menaquinone biosynthesis C-methylase UbiE
MIRAVQLYTFMQYCDESPLEKEVLECGAGIWPTLEPLLVRFHKRGYRTHGIEILDDRLAAALDYAEKHRIDLGIRKGDMRRIPFDDASMSFVFSYNAIFHMTKRDIGTSMAEIERVLKPEGLCFVNYLSVDDAGCGQGEALGKGEYQQIEAGEPTVHTYFEDDEADALFAGFDVLLKEKRILDRMMDGGERLVQGYIDYIARKRS